MSRPDDWTPLDWWEDPVPGSPHNVQDGAQNMLTAAQTISEAAVNLRRIASMEGQVSEAVEAFRDRAQEVAAEIELVHDRYSETGQALSDYVEPLTEAQSKSVEALEKAVSARDRIATAETAAYNASYDLQYALEDADRETAMSALTDANTARGNAEGDLNSARTELSGAIEQRDGAAQMAMARIDQVTKVDGLNDSRWRQFLNKNAAFLDGLGKVLAGIGAALAIAALFIPGVNFLVIGLVLGLGAAGINFALAENGNKGWGDFAMDVFGLATLGVGKVATSVVRMGRGANAAKAASGRARQMRGRRPNYPRKGGGRNGDSQALRRQRRQRKGPMRDKWVAGGRSNQRNEFATHMAAAPDVSVLRPGSMVNAARENISRNGLGTVLKAGGGDAYQMSYYAKIRHTGGGDAAAAVYRADLAAGTIANSETVVSIGTGFIDGDSQIGTWAGDIVDRQVSDRSRQDDVTAVR